MINQIWKYELVVTDTVKLKMPVGATILTLQTDRKNDRPHMWAMVDPTAKLEERTFVTYGTGHDIDMNQPNLLRYIGTYQVLNQLVFHVFEKKEL